MNKPFLVLAALGATMLGALTSPGVADEIMTTPTKPAAAEAVSKGEAVVQKSKLTVRCGPYVTDFSEAAAWTISRMEYDGKLLLSTTGAFQSVVNRKPAPADPQHISWIGTGHGHEVVESLQLEVDGTKHAVADGLRVTGQRFTLIKQSRLGPYLHHARVTFDGQQVVEDFDYEVVGDDSNVNFMYAFMHCFTVNMSRWQAELADKTIQSGEFKSDNSFTLKKDIRWAAVYDDTDTLGLVYFYPQVYEGSKNFSNAFWNRPRDRKLYFRPLLPQGLGQRFGYRVTLQAFTAPQDAWQNKVQEIVAACEKQEREKQEREKQERAAQNN